TGVRALRSVARKRDLAYVNAFHHVGAMRGAGSAIGRASALRTTPQLHFSGDADSTVTPEVAQRFQRAGGGTCSQVDIVSNMTHGSDWAAIWPQLLAKIGRASCREREEITVVTVMQNKIGSDHCNEQ